MLKIADNNGVLLCNGSSLRIDPCRSSDSDYTVISHAHSDHMNFAGNSEFFVSNQTYDLADIKAKNFSKKKSRVKRLDFNKKISFNSYDLSLKSSGHILGSSQIIYEGDKKVVITSDFKMQDSLILDKAEVVDSEILIIESTFGLPEFSFPEREDVYSQIGKWIKENAKRNKLSVLCGYTLGKAQELTKVVNEYADESPLVYEGIYGFNKTYESHGVSLGDYIKLDHNLKDSNVLILPPHFVNSHLVDYLELSIKKGIETAMATGWNFPRRFNKVFPLSDHSDYSGLMEYIKLSNPDLVLTVHGYCKEFSSSVNKELGIPSKPLSEYKQKTLFEC